MNMLDAPHEANDIFFGSEQRHTVVIAYKSDGCTSKDVKHFANAVMLGVRYARQVGKTVMQIDFPNVETCDSCTPSILSRVKGLVYADADRVSGQQIIVIVSDDTYDCDTSDDSDQ